MSTKQSLYHYTNWAEDHILLIMVLKSGYSSAPTAASVSSMMQTFGPLTSHGPGSTALFVQQDSSEKVTSIMQGNINLVKIGVFLLTIYFKLTKIF